MRSLLESTPLVRLDYATLADPDTLDGPTQCGGRLLGEGPEPVVVEESAWVDDPHPRSLLGRLQDDVARKQQRDGRVDLERPVPPMFQPLTVFLTEWYAAVALNGPIAPMTEIAL